MKSTTTTVLLLIVSLLFCTTGCFLDKDGSASVAFNRFLGDLQVKVKDFGIQVDQKFQKYATDGIAIAIRTKVTQDIVFQKTFDKDTTSGELSELLPFFLAEGQEYQISVIIGDMATDWKDIK